MRFFLDASHRRRVTQLFWMVDLFIYVRASLFVFDRFSSRLGCVVVGFSPVVCGLCPGCIGLARFVVN
jgi:hypothetical protein